MTKINGLLSITIRMPASLKKITGNSEVSGVGSTVDELLNDLEANYPGLKNGIRDESGRVKKYVNIYINDEDIRFMENLNTDIKEGDTVSIVPAITGGISCL